MSKGIAKTSALALAVFIIGVLSIGVAGFWIWHAKSTDNAQIAAANDIPVAARVDRLDGDVGIQNINQDPNGQPAASPAADQSQPAAQSTADFTTATVNTPVSTGSRIYVKDNSKAAVAFSGRNYARFNPGTS